MDGKINIVFTIDKDFIKQFTVSLTSLLETNQDIIDRIFLINNIIDDQILKKSLTFFSDKYNLIIEIININDAQFAELRIKSYISIASYFRLILSELIPTDINRILYLDCDLIVTGDLSNLITLKFNDNFLCAVDQEQHISTFSRFKNTPFNGKKYFNSGVMLINLKKWRENNISKILMKNANKYNSQMLHLDQDILNITFYNSWKELDYKYNAWKYSNQSIEKLGIAANDLVIIHFIGPIKPWNFQCNHKYKHLYFKYQKLTPYKNKKYIDKSFTTFLKKVIPSRIKSILKSIK